MVDRSPSRRIFRGVNTAFFIGYALLCLVPMIYVLAMSLSSATAVNAGKVFLWPVDFSWKSYTYTMQRAAFWSGLRISLVRVAIGVSVNMLMTILAAYPLSKTYQEFRGKKFFVWFFLFTMLFSGGMIPSFMIVKYTGLLNTIWSLILPSAVPVYNTIILMNFFKSVPKELEEAAIIDGAGQTRILWRIFLPVSLPAIATLVVFSMVGHWNAWFDGMIYMTDSKNYPLQTYLQSILVSTNVKLITKAQAELLRLVSDRTLKSAQVFIAMIPVLVVYPFLQRYFVAGMTMGSVKE